VTYLIEYLGEFEFIFKTVLGYVSGDQMGSFEAKKKQSQKSHAWAEHTRSNHMRMLSMRITIENSIILANF
jgi:hypothetical protein